MATVVQNEEETVEINGDVLESILFHVSIIDMVSASRVSKCWRRAVSTSLRRRNPPKPWLLLHTQATRFPHATTSHAYDPLSNVWIKISRPSIEYISALNSSPSNFLYMLSSSRFSFSLDPLNSDWCTVSPPSVWRTDPIVALVGNSVVVAGGACYFEDDPLAVEIYDLKTRAWSTCESMPGNLKDSAAATWLSVATTNEKLVIADKQSGITHWFNTESSYWSEPLLLNTGQPISSYRIGCSSGGLILVGVIRTEDGERVKVWRVGEVDFSCDEIGEMPEEFVVGLKVGNENSSIDIRVAGNIIYLYNTWEAADVVSCEVMAGGGCRWWSVRNVVVREGMVAEKLVFSCSEVGIGELQWAMGMKNWRFQIL